MKNFFFKKIMKIVNHTNVYDVCLTKNMNLLKIDHFNLNQRAALSYVKNFFNDIKLIINFVVTKKTRFIVNVFQSFLYNVFIDEKNKKKKSKSIIFVF